MVWSYNKRNAPTIYYKPSFRPTNIRVIIKDTDMRGTYSYTSCTETQHLIDYPTHNRPFNRSLPKSLALYNSNFYNTPRNTSLQTHIHIHFANRSIYSMQPNTILNTYIPQISEEKKPSRAKRGFIAPDSGASTTQCCPLTHTGSPLHIPTHTPAATTQRAA